MQKSVLSRIVIRIKCFTKDFCWLYSLVISLSIFHFYSCANSNIGNNEGNIKKDSIVLIEKPCNSFSGKCNCVKQIFKCDTNVYFIKKYSDSPYKFDSLSNCFNLDLYIYKKKINLDSVYLLNFKNKELLYIGEFISGIYKKDEFIIDLELIFINPAINSSRSTTHCYKIKYDIEKNKILSIKFNFIDDN